MINTWYSMNKKVVENLMYSIRQARAANSLEGLFDLKPVEQCMIMLIGDNVRLSGRVEELEEELNTLRKGQNTK